MNGKPAIKSKTLRTNAGIGLAGIIFVIISVLPVVNEAFAGSSFWAGLVAVAGAIVNARQRYKTREPINGAIRSAASPKRDR